MSWRSLVSTIAPTIGAALGGPVGGLAAKAISSALLGRSDATDDEIETAVASADPEALKALKAADHQFRLDMQKLGVDLARIDQADRASARNREIKTGSRANPVLAGVIVAGFFGVVGWVIYEPSTLTGAAAGVVGTLVGYVSAKADQVVSYYFGSSHGSQRKDLILSRR